MEFSIIAGVNGSGKSTLYHSGELKISELGVRLNFDELVQKKYENQWNNKHVQYQAGKDIIRKIKECIDQNQSFHLETTLSGNYILKAIRNAKIKGFLISLHYIFLNNVDLSIQRVKNREEKGGHGIDQEILIRRYARSLENLKLVLPMCDNVSIYDNSTYYQDILKIVKNKIIYINHCIPDYIHDHLVSFIQTKQS